MVLSHHTHAVCSVQSQQQWEQIWDSCEEQSMQNSLEMQQEGRLTKSLIATKYKEVYECCLWALAEASRESLRMGS